MSISNEPRLRSADLATWLSTPHRFGVARLERPVSMDFYDQWLAAGHHGEMDYLKRHRDLKADPTSWLAYARSALVIAIDYVKPADSNSQNDYVTTPRTALYTRYAPENVDYHDAIRLELEPILQQLREKYPEAQFRLALDAEPVLERDLATRAGLGWVGKNTCVIDRNGGSFFFIAEILTSLETDEVSVEPKDYCGTCTRCMDACPTSALIAPRQLDATKCISYWTIEAKEVAPPSLRDRFGEWFFGCDICQSVCPWNGKVFGRDRMARAAEELVTDRDRLVADLKVILESSNRELQRKFDGTPFSRARGFGLKRNALVVAANRNLHELQPAIEQLRRDEKLKDLVEDVLAKLTAP